MMADGVTEDGDIEDETVFYQFVQDRHPTNKLIGHKAVKHAHTGGKHKYHISMNQ